MSEHTEGADIIENLRRSKSLVGELLPVVIDKRTGKILSGVHRKQAGWTKIEYVTTKTDSEAIKLVAAFNAQRGLTENEKGALFRAMGEALEKEGKTNAEIAHILRFDFIHYNPNYAYTYIPKSYLSDEGRPKGLSFTQNETPPANSAFDERPRTDNDSGDSVHIGKCWNCGVEGKITQTGLEQLTYSTGGQTTTS
jgi:hypothetical protein